MAVVAALPTLATVIVTALIDSINPCAIGVLILMISVLLGSKKSRSQLALYGLTYIAGVYIVYLLAGLGLIYFFSAIPNVVAEYISIVVATIIVIAGMMEVKDFYWYGEGSSLTIPGRFVKRIHSMSRKVSLGGILVLGGFVSAVELPCTGAPYLAITTLLSKYFDWYAFGLLLFYNLIFVLPLLVILGLVLAGVKLHAINRWKQANKPFMRFATGLLLIGLGWLLILIANGFINFG